MLTDDLTDKTPIMGAAVGGYFDIHFTGMKSPVAYVLYLRSGLNVVRRGGKFEEVFEVAKGITSTHKGSYDALYVQLPILLNFHFELPGTRRSQFVRAFVGPAVSYGFNGRYSDEKVTPYSGGTTATNIDPATINYNIHNEPAFDYLKPLDVEIIAGVGYEYKNWNFNLYLDHGFLSTIDEEDALKTAYNENNEPVMRSGASLTSYMVSVGYNIPVGKKKTTEAAPVRYSYTNH